MIAKKIKNIVFHIFDIVVFSLADWFLQLAMKVIKKRK